MYTYSDPENQESFFIDNMPRALQKVEKLSFLRGRSVRGSFYGR